jgi:non-heme chloroperoxidase
MPSLAVPSEAHQPRFFDNDDLLPKLHTPALVVHGAEDKVVDPAVVDQHWAGMPHAQVCLMPNAGHAPFWDDAPTFNNHLRAFCEEL